MTSSDAAPPLVIEKQQIAPPLMLAPMAGITHSAFRRLVSDFGGHGALFSEMLSASALLGENVGISPFTRRRAQEGAVIYQLRLSADDQIEKSFERLKTIEPFAVDINLGCPAPEIRRMQSGAALFENVGNMQQVLMRARSCYSGILTVKCRLGKDQDGWQEQFLLRLRIIEQCGIDAITVHPRFTGEKLKRTARWSLFPWIVSSTKLPVIGNGDIATVKDAAAIIARSGCKGIMIGRMAVVKPWIFAETPSDQINYAESWQRLYSYVCEDFPETKALGRIKEFSAYFARNFFFGHEFYRLVQSSKDLTTLRDRALGFLLKNPALSSSPSVSGL